MASFVSSPIEVIWIFLKKGVYKLTSEGFILSNCFFRCHKPPKRLLLQDYVLWRQVQLLPHGAAAEIQTGPVQGRKLLLQ